VTVRGGASVPNVVTGFDVQELDIIYNCGIAASGAAKVTVTFSLDLYAPITFSYLKHCGGVEKEGFYVSSTTEKAGDVVMDGSVVAEVCVCGSHLFSQSVVCARDQCVPR
jgi:hypothetical protein